MIERGTTSYLGSTNVDLKNDFVKSFGSSASKSGDKGDCNVEPSGFGIYLGLSGSSSSESGGSSLVIASPLRVTPDALLLPGVSAADADTSPMPFTPTPTPLSTKQAFLADTVPNETAKSSYTLPAQSSSLSFLQSTRPSSLPPTDILIARRPIAHTRPKRLSTSESQAGLVDLPSSAPQWPLQQVGR
ncbi:unnamed protein product [Protopolystoma xenopodis]|uniref:Uncharacterized protein n=1 Tax=Protopolystoma xenopodis TaxID=117903 RepID=A0A3S5C8P1_9PLAT|nr:unnamed protein product [Protopolystoma xenopodis]